MARRRSKKAQKKLTDLQVRFFVFKALVIFCFGGLSYKLLEFGLVPGKEPSAPSAYAEKTFVERGTIYDRNGVELALTLDVYSLYADPKMMLNREASVKALQGLFPGLDWADLSERVMTPNKRFVWIKRELTPREVKAVYRLGLPGLGFKEEKVRFYPQKNLYAHALGGMNRAGNGAYGLEFYQNAKLQNGEDIYLTIDSRLQERLHTALENVMGQEGTHAVWGVALDAKSREVLAAVSLPDYDPNKLNGVESDALKNRFAQGVYEMGSTFKVFTIAQGYEEGVIDDESEIDAREPIKIAGFRIRDFHAKRKVMNPEEVLKFSSNIGASKIADMIETDHIKDFYGKLSFLSPVDYGFGGMANPLYPQRNWGRVHKMTMSFGHGIAISSMQLLTGFAALVTDGEVKKPHFFKGEPVEDYTETVLSQETIQTMRRLLHEVTVTGTGRLSRVDGFNVGGKTGTAESSVAGGYDGDRRLSSFLGAVPIEDPELVVLIMIDESQKIGGGGRLAAPAFSEFVRGSIPILGMKPGGGDTWRLLDNKKESTYANHAQKSVAGL